MMLPRSLRWIAAAPALALVPVLLAPISLRAQAPMDLKKGFELLVKAGLPDTKGWTYVAIDTSGLGGDHFAMDPASPLKGNGWQAADVPGPDGAVRLVANGRHPGVFVKGANTSDEKGMELYQKFSSQGKFVTAQEPKTVDEAADASALAQWLKEALADEDRKSQLLSNGDALKQIVYTAAHWHRRGLAKEAGLVIKTLFDSLPRRESLLELVLGDLASARTDAALSDFQETYDWKALEHALTSLVADFPIGWRERVLALRLPEQVKPRAAGAAVPPLSTEFPLTAEQQTWWAALPSFKPTARDPMDPASAATLWLQRQLSPPKSGGPDAWLDEEPWQAGKTWDWIHVMAAALGDETPIPMGMEPSSPDRSSWDSFDPEEPAEELQGTELEEQWRSWRRPKTRGEIAAEFLRSVLPAQGGDQSSEDDPFGSSGPALPPGQQAEKARSVVKEWNTLRQNKQGLELARLYVEKGSQQQKQMAATTIISDGTDADVSTMEEALLASPSESIQLVELVLRRKKAAGKAFLEKYKAALTVVWKQHYAGDETDEKKALAAVPDYEKDRVKALEGLVSNRSLSEVLDDYVAGKMEQQELNRTLSAILGEMTQWKEADLQTLLATVSRIPEGDGTRKYELAGLVSRSITFQQRATGNEAAPAPKPPATWFLDGIRSILEKDGDALVDFGAGADTPLRNLLWHMIDQMWDEVASEKAMAGLLRSLSPDDMWPLFEERGKARLAGEAPPPPPTPEQIPEAKRGEITTRMKSPGAGWAAFTGRLNVAEKIFLAQELHEVELTPEWRKHLLTITEVSVSGAATAQQAALEGLAGQPLQAKSMLTAMQALQKAATGTGMRLRASLQMLPLRGGTKLLVMDEGGTRGRSENVHGWMKNALQQSDAPPPFTALSMVRWVGLNEYHEIVWQRGTDGVWSPVDLDELPEAWQRKRPFNSPLSEADFTTGFDASMQEWDPKSNRWQVDLGVWTLPAEGNP